MMTIIEGIGDEIILFLAIIFIAAVIIYIFIFPSQYISQNAPLLQPSNNLAEQNNTAVSDSFSTQSEESINENTSDSNNQYSNLNCSSLKTDDNPVLNETTDSVQDLPSPAYSISNPEFLRKHRLKFFGEQLVSPNSERINNGLMNSYDVDGEENAVLASQHSEIAVSSKDTVDHSSSSGSNIRIRLKYLNDTERLVHSKLDDKIGDFKRTHFLEDITSNKIIRLIYNGQLLRGEDRTLESFGITNNSVIHVQISQHQQLQGSNTIDDSDLDLSHLMWPLFGIILGVLWMLHFQYREYFNIASTVALVGITGLFLMAVWSQSNFRRGPTLRTGDNHHPRN